MIFGDHMKAWLDTVQDGVQARLSAVECCTKGSCKASPRSQAKGNFIWDTENLPQAL